MISTVEIVNDFCRMGSYHKYSRLEESMGNQSNTVGGNTLTMLGRVPVQSGGGGVWES